MKLDPTKLGVAIAVSAVAASGAASVVVASAQSSPSADLGVAIRTSARHPRAGQPVYFTIKVTNHGPDTAAMFLVRLSTHSGLVKPQVTEAPPDSFQTTCPTATSAGGSASCTTKWIPPVCRSSPTVLTCRYRSLQLTGPSGPSDSITLVVKARAGKHALESAVARVAGSTDPNPANDRATVTLHVRSRRSSATHHAGPRH